ncbi:MAG: DUF438 domain-containing protein [Marinilabiliaceae bacterium]|jgi:DUF438 domain-containing protein|nr:DUF438 domain-containing protein [Marinilabiliaceae bacterium]
MSELINNSRYRKDRLKELILSLHEGAAPEKVREELITTLKSIPYGEVVEVEQELISEGLPETEVLKLCDIHGEVLEGHVDQSGAKEIPPGHPIDVFIQENKAINIAIDKATDLLRSISEVPDESFSNFVLELRSSFNDLMDIDKHYQRKEYLVFPYLERNDITGPPMVMWGKHDEIRDQLKGCIALLREEKLSKKDLDDALDLIYFPVLRTIADMVKKEEEILFPMSMDVLSLDDWWNIHKQTLEFGFTLYDPEIDWKPEGLQDEDGDEKMVGRNDGSVMLPSGSISAEELLAILNTLPVDMTFVDKNDKVKYFSQGQHRIFPRSRSIINRDVRLCHPPGSVDIVEKIIEDFRSGKESHAPFWIQMHGKFILIEYYALRNDNGDYLGTLEVSQDLTNARELKGERRILSYGANKNEVNE